MQNTVVVCRLHYINTLKQELNCTKAYEETSTDFNDVSIPVKHAPVLGWHARHGHL